jgi:hypothetical protein
MSDIAASTQLAPAAPRAVAASAQPLAAFDPMLRGVRSPPSRRSPRACPRSG